MEQVNVRWYVKDISAYSAPMVIAGLPGLGNVGKLVVDHLIHALSVVKIAEITSIFFPPQVYLDENAVLRLPRNELFFLPGTDVHPPILFLSGDCQSVSSEGHYTLVEQYLRIFVLLGVHRIYTLGGYGVGHLVEHPRVLSAISSSSLKEEVLAAGAMINPYEPIGGIIGFAGLLVTLGHLHGIDGVVLLGETSGYLVDPVSSTAVLDVLERLIHVHADRTELSYLAEKMLAEVATHVSASMPQSSDDLRYIG
ncbi:MAG TPA: proteasome assembly chaperone family protein [Methanocorpusculum sp.]|nr:proteasome assembly chaperone family protein [Methanocorpusculum sp.]